MRIIQFLLRVIYFFELLFAFLMASFIALIGYVLFLLFKVIEPLFPGSDVVQEEAEVPSNAE